MLEVLVIDLKNQVAFRFIKKGLWGTWYEILDPQ
jgi:hypothetical protein